MLEFWSGMTDSNRRPSAPKADALPGCANPRLDQFLNPNLKQFSSVIFDYLNLIF